MRQFAGRPSGNARTERVSSFVMGFVNRCGRTLPSLKLQRTTDQHAATVKDAHIILDNWTCDKLWKINQRKNVGDKRFSSGNALET